MAFARAINAYFFRDANSECAGVEAVDGMALAESGGAAGRRMQIAGLLEPSWPLQHGRCIFATSALAELGAALSAHFTMVPRRTGKGTTVWQRVS